jgi:hypothetical protein
MIETKFLGMKKQQELTFQIRQNQSHRTTLACSSLVLYLKSNCRIMD